MEVKTLDLDVAGLKAAGWRSLVLDARDRVQAVRDRLPAQLGGAAGTLAAFTAYGTPDTGALVEAYARELGLAAPVLPWHTLRTPVADLAGALAFTAGALGKAATDVLTGDGVERDRDGRRSLRNRRLRSAGGAAERGHRCRRRHCREQHDLKSCRNHQHLDFMVTGGDDT